MQLFHSSIWFRNIKYELKINFLYIEFKPKYELRKAPKKLLFSDLKGTHSQLLLEKINVVGTLDHFVGNFETNLILASRQLASIYPIG